MHRNTPVSRVQRIGKKRNKCLKHAMIYAAAHDHVGQLLRADMEYYNSIGHSIVATKNIASALKQSLYRLETQILDLGCAQIAFHKQIRKHEQVHELYERFHDQWAKRASLMEKRMEKLCPDVVPETPPHSFVLEGCTPEELEEFLDSSCSFVDDISTSDLDTSVSLSCDDETLDEDCFIFDSQEQ